MTKTKCFIFSMYLQVPQAKHGYIIIDVLIIMLHKINNMPLCTALHIYMCILLLYLTP